MAAKVDNHPQVPCALAASAFAVAMAPPWLHQQHPEQDQLLQIPENHRISINAAAMKLARLTLLWYSCFGPPGPRLAFPR
jgi:hypothetical protein